MFILIIKSIMFSAILGMAIIILRNAPRVALLQTGQGSRIRVSPEKVLNRAKQGIKITTEFAKKNIAVLKNSADKNFKEGPTKLSSGYWEKIRKSK